MADQARTAGAGAGRDRPPPPIPQPPLNTANVLPSRKIAPTNTTPTEGRGPAFDDEELHARAPPVPRSQAHTPGQLSTRTQIQDRQRRPSEVSKASELSIRQRSLSTAVNAAANAASSLTVSQPIYPHAAPPHKAATPTPSSTSYRQPSTTLPDNRDSTHSSTIAIGTAATRERKDSSAGSGREASSRRPAGMRSTSAIASGRPGTSSAVARASGTRGARPGAQMIHHAPFPPLVDPRTAPDVPPAPSSGMYWSKAPISGASHTALRAHTTTLIGSNVYVFGGCDSRTCFNSLYVLDADAFYWSAPQVVGDIPVPLRAMTCTAVGKKLIVFGGGDGPSYYNDVYVLDTVNFRWSKPLIFGKDFPSKRRAHTACLYKNGIYVFGGGDGVRALNDIWRLDVSDINKMSWKLISEGSPGPDDQSSSSSGGNGAGSGGGKGSEVRVSGTTTSGGDIRPKARGYHTANMVGSKLIIYGGSDGGECFNDVWVYDVDTHVWKAVQIPITYRRLSHTATIVGSYLFVIGGHDGNEYSNEVLLLNLVTMSWDKRRVYGLPPSGRGYHGAVLYDSRLLVIGGFDGAEVFGDVWLLELAVHAYYSQISHFTIEV
ncbi:hypothetical protein GE21DRAFT_809 [Neurospora crassa]|uniref:Kelch domain-containing protein-containing protein n=2 Tax=Neurospora crassa TaxID=5141 RepID=Q7SG00_NEUCR|nr:kelch domain-containing protein-containing protein [Neurospora crassa OR74A]EAA35787.1 kelch domain-containing protein-containing protein [Neurospora crassa OR74A]KHE90060.1 hypothetical protein GE21DRAFT_809 [Neurospora crassa]CAE76444.1 conserved hypothetical protein [Neurospora crassa]|eukprot:XP_965023.1 kelch domain-containing protein-containing protein [Neurospora crassa OR74A]